MTTRAQWGAATAFWTFIASLAALQIWWIAGQPGERLLVYRAIVVQSAFYVAWIPFTVAGWRLTRIWDPTRHTFWRLMPRHAVAVGVVAVLHGMTVMAIAIAFGVLSPDRLTLDFTSQLRGRSFSQVLIYAGVVASGHALILHERWRDRQAAAARLESQLADARMAALRSQLHPHLLFNSLHAIATLVREDRNADAVRLIAGMGELLRRVLDTDDAMHSLGSELALVRTYLDIQRTRFGDRLDATIDADAGTDATLVPVLLLQPLVENALVHGLAGKVDTGAVAIRVRREGHTLAITVDDDGVGPGAGWRMGGEGTGLSNLGGRLAALYGATASIQAGAGPHGGFRVTVRLPAAV